MTSSISPSFPQYHHDVNKEHEGSHVQKAPNQAAQPVVNVPPPEVHGHGGGHKAGHPSRIQLTDDIPPSSSQRRHIRYMKASSEAMRQKILKDMEAFETSKKAKVGDEKLKLFHKEEESEEEKKKNDAKEKENKKKKDK